MIKDKRYQIFNKTFSFSFEYENKIQEVSLLDQLDLYPTSKKEADVVVNFVSKVSYTKILQNPTVHTEYQNGFSLKDKKYSVVYQYINSRLYIDILLSSEKGFVGYLKKLYNIGYESIDERSAQIVNELAVIPSVYWDSSKALIHSSGFVTPEGKGVLIGGTGGVGKTSLELELCLNHNFVFLNDDMGIIDQQGSIYPNLAFPKIYSYNLKGNNFLRNTILKPRPFHDKLAWFVMKAILGESKVRRKISPEQLYGKYGQDKVNLSNYFVLVRKNVQEIELIELKKDKAVDMTVEVIKTEYSNFHNHLHWHSFNALASNKNNILNIDSTVSEWRNVLTDALSKVEISLIQIPFDIDHQKLLKEVSNLIKSHC